MKCFASLWILMALGVWLPPSASAAMVAEVETEQLSVETAVAGVDIEERLESNAGMIAREYTFAGNANEVIVLYVENYEIGSDAPKVLNLYGPTGQQIFEHYDYPEDMDFVETEGTHRVFLLPETGSYRLQFEAEAMAVEGTPTPIDFLLKVRVADYFERLMISAYEEFNEERYEETLSLLALATEQSPSSPASYWGRIFTYAEILFESPDFYAQIEALNANFETAEAEDRLFSLIHERFMTLGETAQSSVIKDLRLLEGLYKRAIANGDTEAELEPELFVEVATFLETGVSNAAIRQLLFGTVEN